MPLNLRFAAEQVIRKAVTEGLSANATQKVLRDLGLSYRRTDFLEDFRRIADIPAKTDKLKFVRRDFRPSKSLFTEQTMFQRNRFRYVVSVDVYKPDTGETFSMFTSLAGSIYYTRGEVEEIALSKVSPSIEGSNYIIQRAILSEAFHRKGDIWE